MLQRLVTKATFKLIGAVCFLLANKFSGPSQIEFLENLRESVARNLNVEESSISLSEFYVFSKLSFSLFVGRHEVYPHLQRLEQMEVEERQVKDKEERRQAQQQKDQQLHHERQQMQQEFHQQHQRRQQQHRENQKDMLQQQKLRDQLQQQSYPHTEKFRNKFSSPKAEKSEKEKKN